MKNSLYSVSERQWRRMRKEPLLPGSVIYCQELGESYLVAGDGTPVRVGDVLVLKQPPSAEGAPGPRGAQGLKGDAGRDGVGIQGPPGPKGDPGDVLYVGSDEMKQAVADMRAEMVEHHAKWLSACALAVEEAAKLSPGRSHLVQAVLKRLRARAGL